MAYWPTDYDELTSPADGDKILVNDVSETTVGKKIKWWTITGSKAFLKTYFDTLYASLTAPIKETSGPTTLTTGAISDGQFLKRSGSTIIGSSSGGEPGEGFMINGKLSVTVASNNLTVAIKTLAGNDPSASDKVTVKINGILHDITSALSVTLNAATNWCNAGSSELATHEIDYFAYLGYNSTDGVVIGFSRIPFGRIYSDFSATSTNEKYCAISTITHAASSDPYCVVGRFAATLSAGAGYTWSVPTYTNKNLIQHPICCTRTLSYYPSATPVSGSFTTITRSGVYVVENNKVYIRPNLLITTNGTAAGAIDMSLPFAALSQGMLVGRESAVVGFAIQGATQTICRMAKFDGTYPGGDGYNLFINGSYLIG